MDTLQMPTADYAYLEGVSWDEYEAFLQQAGERPMRSTYDNGRFEIMTLSFEHEWLKRNLGRLIDLLAIVLNMPFQPGGSTTMRRKLKQKGLEPDDCWWFRHEKRMRGRKKRLDLEVDPPPDLATEIDVTRSVIKRMKIYAALRVPEIWRFKANRLKAYLLRADGTYEASDYSKVFPMLALADVQRFLEKAADTDQATLSREFMAWVEKELKPRMNGGRKNGKRGK